MEGVVDSPIELIKVHGVAAVLETFVLHPGAVDCLLVIAPLIGMTGLERLSHPLKHLLVEMQLVEQRSERLFQHLLPNIFATAVGIVPAFVSMSGAMIVDIFALLDLRHDSAAAVDAGHQAREGKLMA